MRSSLFIQFFLFLYFLLPPLQAQDIQKTPEVNEYQKKQIMKNRHFIKEQIVTVAGRAINNLAPARFAVNRRKNKWNAQYV